MKKRSARSLVIARILLAALAAGSYAVALPASAEPAAAAASAPAPERAIPKERLALAARHLAVVEAASWSVQTELRKARETRARGQVECLDELLSRVHVAARAGRALREAIAEASAHGDSEVFERELVRVQYLRDRTARLVGEASRCGEGAIVIERPGATVVRMIAPRLPEAALYPGQPPPHP